MENNRTKLIKLLTGGILFGISLLMPSEGGPVKLILCACAYIVLGAEVAVTAVKRIVRKDFFDENFLMLVATLGAVAVKSYNEAVAVMLFYGIGEFAQDYAVDKSKDNITDLLEMKVTAVHVVKKDKVVECSPEEVKIKDIIRIPAGETVPLDGIALTDGSDVDTKSITGESVPYSVRKGDKVLSGSMVLSAPLTLEVCASYENSTATRILKLVEESENNKAPTEKFITSFAKTYTPVVILTALLLAVIPSLITGMWQLWIHRALTFLVISCPCALVLSVPLSFFAAIGKSASEGILIKGGTQLQTLARSDCFVFDKTGTLTTGEFRIRRITSLNPFTEEEVLSYAAALEENSHHPLARAITTAISAYSVSTSSGKAIRESKALNVKEQSGKGITGEINGKTVIAGNLLLMEQSGIIFQPDENPADETSTLVYVAVDGKAAGYIAIGDSLKPEAPHSIAALKQMGVKKTVMLSGDRNENAFRTGKSAGIDEIFAELLPQDKVEKLKNLKKDCTCTYIGDGINDAPVMMNADCSIAMGKAGSACAVETAGIVIMNDCLTDIPLAFEIAKKTIRNARQNIVLAVSFKVICMILGALGLAGMTLAVFADTGVALLCVLNSMKILRQS